MRLLRWQLLAVFAGLLFPAASQADVKVTTGFSDNMVLPRGKLIEVAGTADPGEEIYVTFEQKTPDGKREEGKAVITGKDGKWSVKIGPYPAGDEPGTLTIKGPEKKDAKGKSSSIALVFRNVKIGEDTPKK
ncbi:MAG: hypothetical protein K8T89_09470 [Planctomycetes bacterium]|nr:hypothetical protein [Planctomycetota bacterium]